MHFMLTCRLSIFVNNVFYWHIGFYYLLSVDLTLIVPDYPILDLQSHGVERPNVVESGDSGDKLFLILIFDKICILCYFNDRKFHRS